MNFGELDFLAVGCRAIPLTNAMTYIKFNLNSLSEEAMITEAQKSYFVLISWKDPPFLIPILMCIV